MRTEANLDQWKELYQAATEIKEQKPWEFLWDLDLIGIRNGAEEDTVFFSILGRGGECYGISVYEGYEGLNDFLMLSMQEALNLTPEYAMSQQKNLTCYWGNREELTEKQRKVIKDLGYKYRGRNQWLYFLSFKPGYRPWQMDREEVIRMTEHLRDLKLALEYYKQADVSVDFENGNMFCFEFGEGKKTWNFGEKPLPFTMFRFKKLILTDEILLEDLAEAEKCDAVLEADVWGTGVTIKDKKYERPANPLLCVIAEAESGMIITCELQEPDDDAGVSIADEIIEFIFEYGAPKEIRVSNVILEAGLEHICDVCGIKLRRMKRLRALEEFQKEMQRQIF